MREAILPPKRRFLQEPQGVTFQKTAFFEAVSFSKKKYLRKIIMYSG
jgi:hypothetical protein